jgi:hypothetical protein
MLDGFLDGGSGRVDADVSDLGTITPPLTCRRLLPRWFGLHAVCGWHVVLNGAAEQGLVKHRWSGVLLRPDSSRDESRDGLEDHCDLRFRPVPWRVLRVPSMISGRRLPRSAIGAARAARIRGTKRRREVVSRAFHPVKSQPTAMRGDRCPMPQHVVSRLAGLSRVGRPLARPVRRFHARS